MDPEYKSGHVESIKRIKVYLTNTNNVRSSPRFDQFRELMNIIR